MKEATALSVPLCLILRVRANTERVSMTSTISIDVGCVGSVESGERDRMSLNEQRQRSAGPPTSLRLALGV